MGEKDSNEELAGDQQSAADNVGALARARAALIDDASEARDVAPLVAAAAGLPRSFRAQVMRALPLLLLAGTGVVLLLSGFYSELQLSRLAQHQAWLQAYAGEQPLFTATALVVVSAGVISTGLPGSIVLVFLAGLLFGTVAGGVIGMLGGSLGSIVLFVAARRFFIGARQPPALLSRVRAGYQRSPTSYTLFMRLLPLFPLGPFSVALAWLGCRWPLFLVSTLLGALLNGIVNAAVGAGLAHVIATRQTLDIGLLTEPRLMVPLFVLGGAALLPALMGLRGRRAKPAPSAPDAP